MFQCVENGSAICKVQSKHPVNGGGGVANITTIAVTIKFGPECCNCTGVSIVCARAQAHSRPQDRISPED